VKESVEFVMPVFLVFVVTHLILIVVGIGSHASRVPEVFGQVSGGLREGLGAFGAWGLLAIFVRAFALGGGTFTGIEAVSNGIAIGPVFVKLTIASEAALLFVAAQTGFIDGPRVMSNMAIDSWLPHRFASLSDRLTTKDGVVLMGWSAIALLVLTRGSVDTLVVMYSVNVFATFCLTEMGMCRFWFSTRRQHEGWVRHISVHVLGLVLCLTILVVMVVEKFGQGAWKTLVITCLLVAACAWVRGHYRSVQAELRRLDRELLDLPPAPRPGGEPDVRQPTAILLV